MKQVLFIVDNFWPTATGGTIRIAKLLKYFKKSEIQPTVLTRKIANMVKYEKHENVSIFRTKAFDVGEYFQKLKKIFKPARQTNNTTGNKDGSVIQNNERLANYVFAPDVDIFWALGSVFQLFKIIKKQKIDILYSSSPCSSVHIAPLIYKLLKGNSKKWVVEFRDPWTFNPFRHPKPFLLEIIDHKLEKLVITKCDKIIVTSDEYKQQFLNKYPSIATDKINFVPNGYDPEDFAGLETRSGYNNNKIKIVHTGNFYGKRSLKPFLQALFSMYKKFPGVADKLEFVQYGVLDPEAIAFNDINFNPIFKCNETIPHKQSLQQTIWANWLLLIPGPGSGTMPGKLYEYMATGNPIIALVDEGPAKKLIEELGLGYTISTTDIEAIETIIMEIVNKIAKFKNLPDKDAINSFDRKSIANSISQILINI
ncbi:MAG: glycosyltransferase [Bacteroidota bacterium]